MLVPAERSFAAQHLLFRCVGLLAKGAVGLLTMGSSHGLWHLVLEVAGFFSYFFTLQSCGCKPEAGSTHATTSLPCFFVFPLIMPRPPVVPERVWRLEEMTQGPLLGMHHSEVKKPALGRQKLPVATVPGLCQTPQDQVKQRT